MKTLANEVAVSTELPKSRRIVTSPEIKNRQLKNLATSLANKHLKQRAPETGRGFE